MSSIQGQRCCAAPIGVLPNEILTLVFFHATEKNDITTGTMSALLLSHISGQWRDLMHSLPDLWTGIEISPLDAHDYDGHTSVSCEVLVERLNHYYRLSDGRPIHILLPDHPDGNETSLVHPSFASFTSALCTQSAHWRRLLIRSDLLEEIFQTEISLPRLTHLEVEQNNSGSAVSISLPVTPALQSIVVRSLHLSNATSMRFYPEDLQMFPLEQLIHLSGSFAVDAFSGHDKRLALLEELVISLLRQDQKPASPMGSIVLPSLERLTVLRSTPGDHPLGAFSCPALRQLRLHDTMCQSTANLCQLLSSSTAGVTTLALTQVDFGPDNSLQDVFSAVPALRSLLLHDSHWLDGSFKKLIGRLVGFELLPLLEDFSYHSKCSVRDDLASFLRSRTTEFIDAVGRSRLNKIKVQTTGDTALSTEFL